MLGGSKYQTMVVMILISMFGSDSLIELMFYTIS